jgi:hypothetical protein
VPVSSEPVIIFATAQMAAGWRAMTMATDLTIGLAHRTGTLASACEALGAAGINIEALAGAVVDTDPQFHVLVADPGRATRALIDQGFDILDQRQVLTIPVDNRPGEGGRLLRRAADAGVNLDLVYTTLDGRLVLGADNLAALRQALVLAAVPA